MYIHICVCVCVCVYVCVCVCIVENQNNKTKIRFPVSNLHFSKSQLLQIILKDNRVGKYYEKNTKYIQQQCNKKKVWNLLEVYNNDTNVTNYSRYLLFNGIYFFKVNN